MITREEIKMFKDSWYTFEEIQKISDSDDAVRRGEVISKEEFWKKFLNYRKELKKDTNNQKNKELSKKINYA